ncbi:MAG: heavy metal translocating P-type ATPase [Prevotellaceae bacterium]|jgi:Cu2+-exporting ATPase|nr:heavy metal translocating P-type ATPase [Prevotellaceae bacterium]
MDTDKTVKKTFPTLQMGCAACATRIEKVIRKQAGVVTVSVNFATATTTVEYQPGIISPKDIRDAVQDAGYELLVNDNDYEDNDADEDDEDAGKTLSEIQRKNFDTLKQNILCAAILSLPIVIISMFFMDMPYGNEIMWLLSTPVIFLWGKNFFVNTWKQAKYRTVSMDTLVALSTGIAYLFSVFNTLFPDFWIKRGVHPHVYFEAAAVIITFILLGRFLEEKAKAGTSSAIKKLIGLQPKTVTVINSEGDETSYTQISVRKITVGTIILAHPGEKIAADGIVTGGSSYVDESMLSGEPAPVSKQLGDKVFAGAINQKGSFVYKALKTGKHTLLAQIISMVQDAQGSRAPVQKSVDRVIEIFVPAVMSIAAISFVIWLIFGGERGITNGLLALVTTMIIACPCALGLATPMAIMVGIGKGAEKGILIKDAESIEMAKKINAIVLDKTGTLTEGRPTVTDIFWLNGDDSKKDILFSLEKQSEHPLSEAITSYFDGLFSGLVDNFESLTGEGIKGMVGGQIYYAGSYNFLFKNNISIDECLVEEANKFGKQSKTTVWFAGEQDAIAVIAIADKIKETSKTAVKQLQAANIEIYMLTGDNEAAASAMAANLGILNYKSGILPQEKAMFVKQLQSEGKIVAMVGDGINDSAALAQADLSIAMGNGSDIAIDVAKMTIISSDLTKIPDAISLSVHTVRTIHQNLFWAFIYNFIGIPIAAGILYPFNGFLLNPMIAGAAMALSSISVVCNSLFPYKFFQRTLYYA